MTDGHPSGSVTRLRELVERVEFEIGRLNADGWVALPCRTCNSAGSGLGVHELHEMLCEAVERLRDYAAALAPAVVPKCVHGIECPWWHQPWMEANSKPAAPPVVAPVAAPVQEQELTLTQKLHVLIAETRRCVADDTMVAAHRKLDAMDALLQASPSLPLTGEMPEAPTCELHGMMVAGLEDLVAYGEEEATNALGRKDRDNYQFWQGWNAALARVASLSPAGGRSGRRDRK